MVVEDLYSEFNINISFDKFKEKVETKIESMGGLCDKRAAAKLVAHEIKGERLLPIEEVSSDLNEVSFLGKITNIQSPRTFKKEDGSKGKVANVKLADETGEIRVSLWDKYADNIKELEKGKVLKVKGKPREGKYGLEISANRAQIEKEAKIEIEATKISEVKEGSNVSLKAKVLDFSPPKKFEKENTKGKVRNLFLADETGWIQAAAWNKKVDDVSRLKRGDCIKIEGHAKKRKGNIEINIGEKDLVEKIEKNIEVNLDTTSVNQLEIGKKYNIKGVVINSESLYKFERENGSQGKVKNIEIKDSTGNINIALWGRNAERNLEIGDKILLLGVQINDGKYQLEGNLNWNGALYFVE